VGFLNLADAATRLIWSEEDAHALSRVANSFRESDPYTIWLHEQGDRWYWTFLRECTEEDEAAMIHLQTKFFSGYVDNLRAALNYLAYQTAVFSLIEYPTLQGKLNPNTVEFPIFNDSGLFRQHNRIKQLPQKYFDWIEHVQPYHGRTDGLWILHELSRENRHRLLHPVAFHPFGKVGGLFSDNLPDSAEDVDITYSGGGLKHGQDLCSFTSSVPFDPHNYPKIQISIGVDHPICETKPLVQAMNEMASDVYSILTAANEGEPIIQGNVFPLTF